MSSSHSPIPTARRYAFWTMAVIILDQCTKFAIEAHFAEFSFSPITPFFNLGLTYNPGAAFSFLASHNGWQKWFFTFLAVVVSVYLAWQIRQHSNLRVLCTGYALIIGGAIGNAIDRLRIGKVVDFLDFHWQGWHYPAFNIADSTIFMGVVMVIWFEWRRGR